MRLTGTKVIGIRAPIIKKGDDIVETAVCCIDDAVCNGELTIDDRDVIGITESVVARASGNYATVDDVANSVREHFGDNKSITVIFPIMSRNRFSIILKGIARAARRVQIIFKAPCDEVGNELYKDWCFGEYCTSYDALQAFGNPKHPFTGINYLECYKNIVETETPGESCDLLITSDCFDKNILQEYYTNIIYAGIHDRDQAVEGLKSVFKAFTPTDYHKIISLADICAKTTNIYGYNPDYGVLGSNKADEETLKLFPTRIRCEFVCNGIQNRIKELYNKDVEVMVYGDGCFKDPVGGIWEFADPVTTPGYTKGLEGTPNELKLKYLADNDFKNHDDAEECIRAAIIEKDNSAFSLKGDMKSQGTTPRRYLDLLASLFDLVSGSGDKGTPIVVVKGYFDNYADT